MQYIRIIQLLLINQGVVKDEKKIFVVMLLLLTSCNGNAHLGFYKNYSNNKLSKERSAVSINSSEKPKE
jgi:hypothetical protein